MSTHLRYHLYKAQLSERYKGEPVKLQTLDFVLFH